MPVKPPAQQAFWSRCQLRLIICAAPLATVEKGHAAAQACGGEIQIELFGNWTLDDARDWYRVGVRRAIYHRGRATRRASGRGAGRVDGAHEGVVRHRPWSLSTITGGITSPICRCSATLTSAFIAGRALAGAAIRRRCRRRIPRPN